MFFPLKDENPTEKRPILTVALIAINVGIFGYTYLSGNLTKAVISFGMVPEQIASGNKLYTVITSMFLHGGPLHILSNGWFLWVFGDNIEDLFGRKKFLLIYFASGITASIAHVIFNLGSPIPTIGASGAVAGILGAYILKYPRAKVVTILFPILIMVPSVVFIGIWIMLQFVSASYTTLVGVEVTTAYWAHVGGFVAGALMALLSKERESVKEEPIYEEYF